MSTNHLLRAALAALALVGAASPSAAQSAAELYPYCAFRSGSTSCYHMTLESCGRSCIRNPGYVGDERARALPRRRHQARPGSRAEPRYAVVRTGSAPPTRA